MTNSAGRVLTLSLIALCTGFLARPAMRWVIQKQLNSEITFTFFALSAPISKTYKAAGPPSTGRPSVTQRSKPPSM